MDIEDEGTGEIFTVSQDYRAADIEDVSVHRGEKVLLVTTKGKDPLKDVQFEFEDIDFGIDTEGLLDCSGARHKMTIKPKRNHPTNIPITIEEDMRWKIQSLEDPLKQGWIPLVLLTPHEEPLELLTKQDVMFRREAVISELIETEEEFCRDLVQVVDHYLRPLDGSGVPRFVSDKQDILFSNFKEIAVFHNTVLLEGIKYYAKEPRSLGRTFLRMERDFDKHVSYCHDEPAAQEFLQSNENVRDFFDDLGARLHDDKSLSEHLKLPIQRINDYQLLLKELVKYSERLGEDTTDLHKALELMLGIPTRAEDSKFITNIEGYHGDIHKLGRLLRHNWFKVKGKDGKSHDRYLFLFKARILICKVRKISKDRYVFVLKEIIRLPDIEVKDHKESSRSFEVGPYTLTSHQDHVKEAWLAEIKHYSKNSLTLAEHAADDLRLQEEGNKNILPLKGVELETPAHSLSNSDEEMDKFSASKRTSISRRVEEHRSSSITESSVHMTSSTSSRTVLMEMSSGGYIEEVGSRTKTITDRSIFSKTIEGMKAQPGGSAAFECEVDAESIVWLKDNKPIPDRLSGRITRSSVGSSHRLEITDVTESDAGVYTAHAKIPSGDVTSCTANLVVQALTEEEKQAKAAANAPVFLVRLKDTELLLETYLRFLIKVKGEPNPIVKFFKDDELISSKNERIKIDNEKASTGYYELIIPEVRKEDAGVYKCIASNKYGQVSCEGSVTVVDSVQLEPEIIEYEPVMKEEPVPKKPLVESPQQIVIPEPVPIIPPVATPQQTLITEEKKIKDVSTKTKTVKTESKEKKVVTDMKSVKAEEKKVFEGIKEVTKGGQEPVFTWLKDGKPFNPEERFKVLFQDDQDSLALVFTHVKPEDAGLYTCVASTSSGKISCSAELTVQGNVNLLFREPEVPHIKSCKKEIEANTGSSTMLETKVKGYPKPEVKWVKDGKEIVMSDRFRLLYEDEETISLVIMSVNLSDTGEYKAVASNCAGQAEDTLNLTVKAPPNFSKKLDDVSLMAGKELKLKVQVEANPKPSVTWFKDGKEVKESEHIKIIEEGTSFTLLIDHCTLFDAGSYSVVCKNEISQSSEFCKVEVLGPPVFTRNLIKKVDTEEGDSLTFLVKVYGNPMPYVKWFFKGEQVFPDARCKISHDIDTFSLTVNSITRNDGGEYTCELTNMHGTNVDRGTVMVKCSPKITKPLGNMIAQEGDTNVGFSVDIDSYPKGKVRWFHNDKEITETHSDYTIKENESHFKLVLKTVTRESSGKFSCKIENDYGTDECFAELTVLCKPLFKKQLKDVRVDEGDTLNLQIEVEGTPEPQIKWFKDGQEVVSDAHIKITRNNKRIETYELTVNLIRAEDSGEYTVHAINEMGTAVTKSTVIVQTSSTGGVFENSTELREKSQIEDQYSSGEVYEKQRKDDVEASILHNTKEETLYKTEKGEESEGPILERKITIENSNSNKELVVESELQQDIANVENKLPCKNLSDQKISSLENMQHGIIDEPSTEKKICIETLNNKLEASAELLQYEIDVQIPPPLKKISIQSSNNCESSVEYTHQPVDTNECPSAKKLHVTNMNGKIDSAVLSEQHSFEEEVKSDSLSLDVNTVFVKLHQGNQDESIKSTTDELISAVSASGDDECGKMIDNKETDAQEKDSIIHGKDGDVDPTVFALSQNEMHNGNKINSQLDESKYANIGEGNELKKCTFNDNNDKQEIISLLNGSESNKSSKHVSSIDSIKKPNEIQMDDSLGIPYSGNKMGIQCSEELEAVNADNKESKINVTDGSKLYHGGSEENALTQPGDGTNGSFKTEEHFGSSEPSEKILTSEPKISVNKEINESHTTDNSSLNTKHQSTLDTPIKQGKQTQEASPQITKSYMKDSDVYETWETSFKIEANGIPRPTAKWYRDGTELKPSEKLIMSDNCEEYSLDVLDCQLDDAGTYKVVVSNVLGEASESATLNIIPARNFRLPVIKTPLMDLSIPKDEKVVLTVVLSADPVPEITWKHDGKDISPEFIVEHDSKQTHHGLKECTYKLTILRGKHENTGIYSFHAANKSGEADCSARLDIVLQPEIKSFGDLTVIPYEDAQFVAVIHSNPRATITWRKDGNKISNDDHYVIETDSEKEIYKLRVKDILLEDAGVYTVSAVNSLGEASADAKLRIHTEMPRFTRGLENITVREYAQLDMKVRAEGVPKPEIQWSRNGVDLVESDGMTLETKCEGQVSSHLMIPHFKPDQAGKYTVRAYNLAGHADTTCDVILDLIPPRLSKSLERAVHLEEGDPLELRCKIEASPNATAKWLKDGEELKESDRIKMILGPDGSVRLHIDHCTPEDCGAYKLIISNVLGSDFSICAVAVTPNPRRPTFIKELKNIVITEGEPLLLEAKVMAFPLPELKWTKDGITVRQSRNLNFINSPGGIVGLSIDSVSPEHKGLYTLIAANKLGEATSDAMVEIKLKDRRPEFLAHLSPTTVVEGFPVKFNVKVVATPIPELIWSRNDTPVEIDGERIKVIELPDGEISLVINNTTPSDAGVYSVRAVNCAGAITSEAKLQVVEKIRPDMPEEKPDFIHVLRDAWAEEGSHLVFLIPYMGNPIPDVTWYKDGQLITPDDRIMITNDGNKVGLVINPCEMGDVGEYKCKLSSKLGEAEISASANVRKVFHAPVFIQKLQDLEQVTGLDGKLTCRVTGNPRPEIKWFKDNIPIFKSKKYSMKEDGENCLLCIRDCASEDEGQYSCVARNRDGEDKCEAYFTPVEKIATKIKGEAPCFLKKIGDQEVIKGITGRFTACISGYPEPEIEWYRNNERIYPSERITMEKETTGLIRLTVARIDPTTDCGTYRLRIHNDLGEDECEASFINDTIEVRELRPVGDQYKDFDTFKNTGAPVPLPDKPIISKMTDRRLTLSWKPSIPIGPREPVTYQVEMLELPNGEWFHVRSGIRSCTCEIRNLEPFRDYKFRVRVENKYGVSDPSPFAITHRAKLEPEPPKFIPYLAPGIDFRPETSPYFPKDFDIERPPHDGYSQAPRFLRQEQYTQYGVKGHSSNLYWFVYGYPKPKMTYYFNDELIEMGGRFDTSYTRNGQATLFINKMLDRDVGSYEAVATNEHGEARQRVHLEIAEYPEFIQRPEEITIFSRHSGKIEARVIGVPQPTIKWFKDWQPLAPTSRIRMHRVDPDHCSLTISDAISKDGGLYSITASNLAGAISSSVMVTIEEKDEHPFHIYGRGHNIKPKTILLREHYDLGDELGRGTQGVTYHSVERYSGRNYAAKAMYGRGELKSLMHDEIDIMNQLNHHKLIKIHDAYETLNSLTIITELAAGGELLDWLTKQSYTSESEIASYIRQLLCGLDYMHDQNIAHLGLNPGDLLLSHPGSDDLKLCDFGLSRRIHPGQLAPLEYGMPEFVSPETIKGDGVDTSSDMWSLGVITYLLLTGVSLFRGNNDMETLTKVREGFWEFDEEWWKYLSVTARDFITKLLVIDPKDRMSVKEALRHPWLNYADRLPPNEHRISTENLQKYYSLYKDWYKNASCRNWYRRRPLIGAFNHPSRMVYPPNYIATPTESPERETKEKCKPSWIEQLPSRQPLNYDMDVITSESHYQNGPDTYLLQLRDVDFPVRIREYMKVAATTGSGVTRFSEDSHLDWRLPVIRERRRFMDVMDEEIDDERKQRISQYGIGDSYTVRRLKHELGARLDTHVEAEALIEAARKGQAPFMREKPHIAPIEEGKPAELVCYAVGDPPPTIQWFRNDMLLAPNNRLHIIEDNKGRSILRLSSATCIDAGIYKAVARNKMGQTVSRARMVLATVPDAPDSPEACGISDTEILLRWKQPKNDGNSPVFCYSVQFKTVEDADWRDVSNTIDHEFFLVHGLKPSTGYIFRLASRNAIGWGPKGIPTEVIRTSQEGCPPVEMTRTMRHLQAISESGQEVVEETKEELDYSVETKPVEWNRHQPTEKFTFISEIFRGRFSVIVKGIDKTCDKVVVAKVLEYSQSTEQKVNYEFEALRSLRHERIACLLEAYKPLDASFCVFILEKLQGADILTYLSSRHEYTEQMVATIISQVLDALQYLHWRGVCHLDLQPDNVVMSSIRSVQVKLVDMGNAERVSKLGSIVRTNGNMEYTAPEVLCQEPAYPQSDIWSVGVLAYVMLSGVSPFHGNDPGETRQNINFVRYRFEHLYKELTPEATRFLMLVFKRAPNKRPTAEQCHEHRWLLPTEYMIRRRERAVFLGHRLKDYSENYHRAREEEASTLETLTCLVSGKGPLLRSTSIKEELITAK